MQQRDDQIPPPLTNVLLMLKKGGQFLIYDHIVYATVFIQGNEVNSIQIQFKKIYSI